MNEIEKMYRNANIKICKRKQGFTLKDCTDRDCKECGCYDMPPFTAEKQWALIKFLMMRETLTIRYWDNIELYQIIYKTKHYYGKTIEECLAKVINNLWQDLTEEEQQQIKEILND